MKKWTTLMICSLLALGCEPRGGDQVNNGSTTPGGNNMEVKPGLVLVDKEGTVSEDGTIATFEITLSRLPDAPVTLHPVSLDTGEGRVEPAELTFTSDNWDVPQELRVQGVDDLFADRAQVYPVYIGLTSQDAGFRPPKPITMTTLDNDEANFWVDVIQDTVHEDHSQNAQVRLRIATPPVAHIEFEFSTSDMDEIQPIPNAIFSPGDPLIKDIWIQGNDDMQADGDQMFDLVIKPIVPSDKSYALLDPTRVELLSIDGVCGNSVLEAAEGCDDGNTTTEVCDYGLSCCTVCNSSCNEAAGALTGYCGDQIVQSNFEACDGDAATQCFSIMRDHGEALCQNACQDLDTSNCHMHQATALALGTDHGCFLTTPDPFAPSGIKCWGDNRHGASTPPNTVQGPALIASGDGFSCVGQGDSVLCWGDNAPTEYNTMGDVISLSASGDRACSLSSAGDIRCEGTIFNPAPPAPPANDPLKEVHVGTGHTCWLSEAGVVSCWVHTDTGNLKPPNDVLFDKISVGGFAACGIDFSGNLHCWGRRELSTPPAGAGFVDVSVGANAACAIRDDLSVVCWGDPLIADETPEDDFLASSVEVGAHGACALYNDSDIRCWGRNLRDRVGDPSANHAVEDLIAGASHVCTWRGDEISCWGESFQGGTEVPSRVEVGAAAAGDDFTCYQNMGSSDFSCVGRSNIVQSATWTDPNTKLSARALTVCAEVPGVSLSCQGNDISLAQNDAIFGIANDGQVCTQGVDGDISAPCSVTESALPRLKQCADDDFDGTFEETSTGFWELIEMQSLSIREDVTCGTFTRGAGCGMGPPQDLGCCCDGAVGRCCIQENQELYAKLCAPNIGERTVLCFDRTDPSDYTLIGIGPDVDEMTPFPIEPESLVSGRAHSCVLSISGEIYCWGDNSHGQLSPPQQNELPPFKKLFASEDFTCGIDFFDRYMCWGSFVMPRR